MTAASKKLRQKPRVKLRIESRSRFWIFDVWCLSCKNVVFAKVQKTTLLSQVRWTPRVVYRAIWRDWGESQVVLFKGCRCWRPRHSDAGWVMEGHCADSAAVWSTAREPSQSLTDGIIAGPAATCALLCVSVCAVVMGPFQFLKIDTTSIFSNLKYRR